MNYDRAVTLANNRLRELLDKPMLGPSPIVYRDYVAPIKRLVSRYTHVISKENILMILNNATLISYHEIIRTILPYITTDDLESVPDNILCTSSALMQKLPMSRLKRMAKKYDSARLILEPDKCYSFDVGPLQLSNAIFGMYIYKTIVCGKNSKYWLLVPVCYPIATVDRIRKIMRTIHRGNKKSADMWHTSRGSIELFILTGCLSILPPKLAISVIDYFCKYFNEYIIYKLLLRKFLNVVRLHYKVYDYMLNKPFLSSLFYIDEYDIKRVLNSGMLKVRLPTQTKIELIIKYGFKPHDILDNSEFNSYGRTIVTNKLKQF